MKRFFAFFIPHLSRRAHLTEAKNPTPAELLSNAELEADKKLVTEGLTLGWQPRRCCERMTGSEELDAEDRIAQIYELYAGDITSYFLRRCSASDAADGVAETFLVAWKRCDIVPGEPDTLPWLYGVARNVLANQRRGNVRRSNLGEKLAGQIERVDTSTPPASFEAAEEMRNVELALSRMAPDDAELLRLAAWESMTPAEIADIMGVSSGSVRQRLYRARRKLKRMLDKIEHGDSASNMSKVIGLGTRPMMIAPTAREVGTNE